MYGWTDVEGAIGGAGRRGAVLSNIDNVFTKLRKMFCGLDQTLNTSDLARE